MNILFIAPFSPPHTGNSLPVKIMHDELSSSHHIDVVNLSKKGYKSGGFSIDKILQTLRIIGEVWKKRKNRDLIYITVAESFSGNMRDIIFYLINYKNLNKTVIHMLGGAGMKNIIEKNRGLQYRLNKFFISRLAGVIVEGKPQADFFAKVISRSKIHIIPNFAEDFLFTTEDQIKGNFTDTDPLKIIFLSNLLYGKGHEELAAAYLSLNDTLKEKIKIDFAGGFESDAAKSEFMKKINGYEGIVYHGHVNGEQKKELYTRSHVFCLPTYYPYEGQPFCILEAYATGNVVVTTNHSGISQVFSDKINGFEVEKKSIDSLRITLEKMVDQRESLSNIALFNLKESREKYTTAAYKKSVTEVFNSVAAIAN